MVTQVRDRLELKQFAIKLAPFLIILLAGLAARTSYSASYPTIALLLFLWVVSDTMMLALIARAPGKRPSWQVIVSTQASACIIVWLSSPAALQEALLTIPAIAAAMAIIVIMNVVWAIARAKRIFRAKAASNKELCLKIASEFLPPPLVRVAAAELSIIHMALFRWGGPPDMPSDSRAFSYHKHLAPICTTLLVLSFIEIAVYHLLLSQWSPEAAFIMFILSDVGFVYLVGLIKSFRFRPVLITSEGVQIRTGFLIDRLIPLDNIASVETIPSGNDVRDPATLNAALLAWPNIALRLTDPVARRSLLRRRKPISLVAFRLDDPEPFVKLLRWRLG